MVKDKIKLTESPFTPHLGTIPKAFIGREKEIEIFKNLLSDALINKPSNILLTGQRGFGKTVLMKYLAGIAKEKGFIPVYIPLDESLSDITSLTRRIYGKIKAEMENEFISLKAKKLLSKISPKISHKINDYEIQMSLAITEEEITDTNFSIFLGKLLKGRNVCIFLDETQCILKNGISRYLVNVLYAELPDKAKNWIFTMAGVPILEEKILKATPADRAFEKMIVKAINVADARNILIDTVKNTPISFEKDVCESISETTQGMPFYIQFVGDILFKLKKKGIINNKFYNENKSSIFAELSKKVFSIRLKDISSKGLQLDTIINIAAKQGRTGVATKYLSNQIKTKNIGVYLKRLEEKGYINKIKRGEYKIQDNLFHQYILEYKNQINNKNN